MRSSSKVKCQNRPRPGSLASCIDDPPLVASERELAPHRRRYHYRGDYGAALHEFVAQTANFAARDILVERKRLLVCARAANVPDANLTGIELAFYRVRRDLSRALAATRRAKRKRLRRLQAAQAVPTPALPAT